MKLKKDKQIDRLIIEKVLELPYHESDMFGYWVTLKDEQDAVLFSPSSNIQDAWVVIEKITIDFISLSKFSAMYECKLANDFQAFRGYGETPSLAICQATLKSKGIEI